MFPSFNFRVREPSLGELKDGRRVSSQSVPYSTLSEYNNRDRFVSSSFIYKRPARPRFTVNFRKRYWTVHPSLHTGPPFFPYSSTNTACLYSDKEVDCNYQSLPFLIPPFFFRSFLDQPPFDLVPLRSLFSPIVLHQLVEISSFRNNFTTTTIAPSPSRRSPPLPSYLRPFLLPKLHHGHNRRLRRSKKSTKTEDEGRRNAFLRRTHGNTTMPRSKKWIPRFKEGKHYDGVRFARKLKLAIKLYPSCV